MVLPLFQHSLAKLIEFHMPHALSKLIEFHTQNLDMIQAILSDRSCLSVVEYGPVAQAPIVVVAIRSGR